MRLFLVPEIEAGLDTGNRFQKCWGLEWATLCWNWYLSNCEKQEEKERWGSKGGNVEGRDRVEGGERREKKSETGELGREGERFRGHLRDL